MNVDPSGLYGVTINGQYVNGTFDISQPETYKNLTSTYVPAPTSFAHPSGYTDHSAGTNTNTGGAYGSLSDAQLGGVNAAGTVSAAYGGNATLGKGGGLQFGVYATTGEAGQSLWGGLDSGFFMTRSTSTGFGVGAGWGIDYWNGGRSNFDGQAVTNTLCFTIACGAVHTSSSSGSFIGLGLSPFGDSGGGIIPGGSFTHSNDYTTSYTIRDFINWVGRK